MDRRTLLARAGLSIGSVTAISGCTEELLEEAETNPPILDVDEEELELPFHQRADAVETGIMAAEGATIEDLDGFESFLGEHALSVEAVDEVEKVIEEKLEIEREDVEVIEAGPHGEGLVLEVEFVQTERFDAGILDSIGLIAGAYAALVAAGSETELLEATVLDEAGNPFGSFHVLRAWAEEYNDGLISARVYGGKPWMSAKTE